MSSESIAMLAPVEAGAPRRFTLFELIQAVNESTDDDREVIATLRDLFGSGRARLGGGSRGASDRGFCTGWYPGR